MRVGVNRRNEMLYSRVHGASGSQGTMFIFKRIPRCLQQGAPSPFHRAVVKASECVGLA